jgi:hypothetical protein
MFDGVLLVVMSPRVMLGKDLLQTTALLCVFGGLSAWCGNTHNKGGFRRQCLIIIYNLTVNVHRKKERTNEQNHQQRERRRCHRVINPSLYSTTSY